MPTATITITINTSKYTRDADVQSRVEAIDLSGDLQHPMMLGLTIDRSATTIHAPGVVRRVLEIVLSADFVAAYPTAPLQQAAFGGLFVSTLKAKLPALDVSSTTVIR